MSISGLCRSIFNLPRVIYSFLVQEGMCAKICFGHFKSLEEELQKNTGEKHCSLSDLEELRIAQMLFIAFQDVVQHVSSVYTELLLEKIRDSNAKLYNKLNSSKKSSYKKLNESIHIFAKASKRTANILIFCLIFNALLIVGVTFEIIQRVKTQYGTLSKLLSNAFLCFAIAFSLILFFLNCALYGSARKQTKVLESLNFFKEKGSDTTQRPTYNVFNCIDSCLLFFIVFFASLAITVLYLNHKKYDFANFSEQDLIITTAVITLALVSFISMFYVIFNAYASFVTEELTLKFRGKDRMIFELLNSSEKCDKKAQDLLSCSFEFVETAICSKNEHRIDIKSIFLAKDLFTKLELDVKKSLFSMLSKKSKKVCLKYMDALKCQTITRLEKFLLGSGCEEVDAFKSVECDLLAKVGCLILRRDLDGSYDIDSGLGETLNKITDLPALVVYQDQSGKLIGKLVVNKETPDQKKDTITISSILPKMEMSIA